MLEPTESQTLEARSSNTQSSDGNQKDRKHSISWDESTTSNLKAEMTESGANHHSDQNTEPGPVRIHDNKQSYVSSTIEQPVIELLSELSNDSLALPDESQVHTRIQGHSVDKLSTNSSRKKPEDLKYPERTRENDIKEAPSLNDNVDVGERVSNSQSYLCQICSVPCKSFCDWYSHIQIHSGLEQTISCPKCQMLLSKISSLLSHTVKHHLRVLSDIERVNILWEVFNVGNSNHADSVGPTTKGSVKCSSVSNQSKKKLSSAQRGRPFGSRNKNKPNSDEQRSEKGSFDKKLTRGRRKDVKMEIKVTENKEINDNEIDTVGNTNHAPHTEEVVNNIPKELDPFAERECPECNKRLGSRGALTLHLRAKHGIIKPYPGPYKQIYKW